MSTVYTSCRICQQRCGIAVTVDEGRVTRIGPDKANPYSWRDFCVKGRTAAALVEHPHRITSPMRRVGDRYVSASYDDAVDDMARSIRSIIERVGPDGVAVYFGNPAGFNAAAIPSLHRFMNALGSRSVFNYGSVDTNGWAIACGEMYGTTFFPMIPDVDDCDFFLLVGANPAESKMNWVESVPNGWARIMARVGDGADLVVVDPYRTKTADSATLHIAPLPGQDWALLLAILKVLFANGLVDESECARIGDGLDDIRALASAASVDELADRAGLDVGTIESVALQFGRARTALALGRTGVSQTSRGTIALWLIEILNIVTGRWDTPGGRYFQPPTTRLRLPLYDAAPHVSRVARRPAIEGTHAVAELPDEITTPGPGQVRALFVDHGNPVISGPEGGALDAALQDLELLVAVDLVQRESHRSAHWLIPGTHWLERAEIAPLQSVTQELPFVQFAQRAVSPPPGVVPEWKFYEMLGSRLGLPGYGPDDPRSTPEDDWQRVMTRGGRIDWAELLQNPHGVMLGPREYGHAAAFLRTADQRVRLAPPRFIAECRRQLSTTPPSAPAGFPLQLGNRRRMSSMNSYLNDLPGSQRLVTTNRVEMHVDDARRAGVSAGSRARVRSSVGQIELEVAISDAPRPGVVVVEHGWGSRVFDPSGSSDPRAHGANRNELSARSEEDRLSLMSAFNETWVAVEPMLDTTAKSHEPTAE